jgi:hypothetical protein
MPQADSVHSTPPLNALASQYPATSAPGAVQLSPRALIPTSPPDACQGVKTQPEPSRGSEILGSGAVVSRRSIMNMLVSTAIAGTAVPAVATRAAALPADDSALLKLEEQIFEQRELASVHDDEIIRLSTIWSDASRQLYQQSLDAEGNCSLTPQQRWDIITAMPESIEHNRLCRLQDPFLAKMDALIKEMFAMPAHTAEGRRAKVTVLLVCVLGDDWIHVDEQTDYPELMRNSPSGEGDAGAVISNAPDWKANWSANWRPHQRA